MKVHDLITFFTNNYPSDLAYEWDNVGLQIGSKEANVKGVHIALDLTKEVVQEAVNHDANVIITHHPFIFKPLSEIDLDTYRGDIIKTLITHDITVFSAHTNYDIGTNGMNKVLADKLKLKNQRPLAMVTDREGIGRIGTVPKMALRDFIDHVKESLQLTTVRLISTKTRVAVETVAILGGSGASEDMESAHRENVDIYLTGDISYHEAHDILNVGLTALDIGHAAEHHFAGSLKTELTNAFSTLTVTTSQHNFDPFKVV